jgi:hypothetical protein
VLVFPCDSLWFVIPAVAITHIMDPNAIGVASKNGVRILSAEEAAKELPQYPGLGVNLTGTVLRA